jgi:hypothetical protein
MDPAYGIAQPSLACAGLIWERQSDPSSARKSLFNIEYSNSKDEEKSRRSVENRQAECRRVVLSGRRRLL